MASMSPPAPVIPTPLEEIASFLRGSPDLQNQISAGGDARLAAANSELGVISLLQNQRRWDITGKNIGRNNNRAEYDFKVNWDGGDVFVDIKVSGLKQADNTNCKAGIYHALTGNPPEEAPVPYENYFRALRDNCKSTAADFYFLIIGKNAQGGDERRSFVCTLRTLRDIVPNGHNPPFQCNWGKCMRPRLRTYEQAKEFLLGNYLASLKKQAAALIAFQQYFPDIGREEAQNHAVSSPLHPALAGKRGGAVTG